MFNLLSNLFKQLWCAYHEITFYLIDISLSFVGVIIFYELWLRMVRGSGAAKLVFNPSGQYDPLGMSAVLPPPATTFTVNNLSPFTEYDLQVVAQNQAGKVSSNWTRSHTAEASEFLLLEVDCLQCSDTCMQDRAACCCNHRLLFLRAMKKVCTSYELLHQSKPILA